MYGEREHLTHHHDRPFMTQTVKGLTSMWALKELESGHFLCRSDVPTQLRADASKAILYDDEEEAMRHCDAWNRFKKHEFLRVEMVK